MNDSAFIQGGVDTRFLPGLLEAGSLGLGAAQPEVDHA